MTISKEMIYLTISLFECSFILDFRPRMATSKAWSWAQPLNGHVPSTNSALLSQTLARKWEPKTISDHADLWKTFSSSHREPQGKTSKSGSLSTRLGSYMIWETADLLWFHLCDPFFGRVEYKQTVTYFEVITWLQGNSNLHVSLYNLPINPLQFLLVFKGTRLWHIMFGSPLISSTRRPKTIAVLLKLALFSILGYMVVPWQ